MTETQLVNTGAWIIATLFGILVILLGWLGNKIFHVLEQMNARMAEFSETLHGRITDLDRRVTRVEAAVERPQVFSQRAPQWPPAMGK
jgi:cell division protein FtsB